MSQHSALASLTAQYTDSEDEAELEAEEYAQLQNKGKDSPPNSPLYMIPGGGHDPSFGEESIKLFHHRQQSSSKQSSAGGVSQQASLGGLVSYQDDLIDDDAVDDVYTSDSNTGTGGGDGLEELVEEDEQVIKGTLSMDNENVATVIESPLKNGDAEIEVVNLEEDGGVIKKKSMIPPEPFGKCTPELQEKFAKMYEKKIKGGLDMNLAIQRNKNFRNPSIYEKLIKYCDIDELGSNYPTSVFDPHEWHASSYYDELAKAQKELMEKRERDRKERTKVDFVSCTVKKTTSTAHEIEPKRKSKWDQRGVMPPLLLPAPYSQAPVILPPFTNTASGTKSTVISAFGNINRKK